MLRKANLPGKRRRTSLRLRAPAKPEDGAGEEIPSGGEGEAANPSSDAKSDGEQAETAEAAAPAAEATAPEAAPASQAQAPPEAVLKLAGKNLCEGTGETVLPGQTNPVPKATADTCAKAAEVAGEKEKNWGPKKDGKMPLSLTPPIPTEKQAQVGWFKSCCEESKEDAGSNSC
eukprot:g12883.t1